MKRLGNRLWEKMLTLENFRKAFNRASKGRGFNSDIRKIRGVIRPGETWEAYFIRRDRRIDRYLQHIIYQLQTFKYTTGQYSLKYMCDPKPRIIYVLRMYPHRIVQHAAIQVVKDYLDKLFIYHNYACRDKKGQQRASKQLSKYIKKCEYCLQGDAKKFYPSIHHDTLYKILEHKIKDKYLLRLFRDIIDSMPGETNVPIGNYTSQWFGNMYMNQLDMFVKHTLKCKYYMRYMDDFFLFSNDKQQLHIWHNEIIKFLETELKLQLSKGKVLKYTQGVSGLGFRHFRSHKLLTKRSAKIIKKRFKTLPEKWNNNKINLYTFTSTLASTKGWVKDANCYNFKSTLHLMELLAFTTKVRKERQMRGFPDYLAIATHEDVENLLPLFPKETCQFLKDLVTDNYIWQTSSEQILETEEQGIVDATHRVVPAYTEDMQQKGFVQQELVEDQNSRLHRLGYTVAKVTQLVNSLSS